MTQCYIESPDGLAVKCDDCGWTGTTDQTDEVSDIEQRLEAGGEVPAGECPDCGALAYLVDNPHKPAEPVNAELLEALDDIGKHAKANSVGSFNISADRVYHARELAKKRSMLYDVAAHDPVSGECRQIVKGTSDPDNVRALLELLNPRCEINQRDHESD